MIKFKVCPKCRGDLYLREDSFGKYASCLQCGYLKDVVEGKLVVNPAPATGRESKRDAA